MQYSKYEQVYSLSFHEKGGIMLIWFDYQQKSRGKYDCTSTGVKFLFFDICTNVNFIVKFKKF